MARGLERDRLLKSMPDSIPDLVHELGETRTTADDQLVLTSLSIELNAAGLTWDDVANLIRFQIVAHRRATMRGHIQALKAHPKNGRLSEWEKGFLTDIHRRNQLLTERQMAVVHSIGESLALNDDDFALKLIASRPAMTGSGIA